MKKKKDERSKQADTEARIGLEIKRIWADDLFQRRAEAEMLHAYIVSAAQRATNMERAFTIAVDAGYGEGKTFFLRRLAEHLATRHPVAFVDAWADDIVDEPLTALAATLKRALDPLLARSPTVRERWKNVLEKTSVIARLAAVGAVKRGLGLFFTSVAVETAAEVLQDIREEVRSAVEEDLQTSGSDVVSSAAGVVAPPRRLMQKRIDAFEEGRQAVAELKASLSALVEALGEKDQTPPIVIVVDELDRCRPPYAIKLLEEIKHLFDVPGLVFVFGMHGSQLAHSVAGAYGPSFDGRAYLRRFVQREYHLKTPPLVRLLKKLLETAGVDQTRLWFDPVATGENVHHRLPPAEMISRYMKIFRLSPRDAFALVDLIQTCLAVTQAPLLMGYLMPLLIGRILGLPSGTLPQPEPGESFTYKIATEDGMLTLSPHAFAQSVRAACSLSERELLTAASRGLDAGSVAIAKLQENNRLVADKLASPRRYDELIETVDRFEHPDARPRREAAETMRIGTKRK